MVFCDPSLRFPPHRYPDLCSHVLSGTSVPTQGLQLVGATSEGESSDYRGNLPAPLVIDPDAEETLQVALESLQPVRGR